MHKVKGLDLFKTISLLVVLFLFIINAIYSDGNKTEFAYAQVGPMPSPSSTPMFMCSDYSGYTDCNDYSGTGSCATTVVADQCPAPNTRCRSTSQGGTTHYCCCPPASPTPTPCGSLTAPACGGGTCPFAGQTCRDVSGTCTCQRDCNAIGLIVCDGAYCAPGTGTCTSVSGMCSCATPTPAPTPCMVCANGRPLGFSDCDGTRVRECIQNPDPNMTCGYSYLDCATFGKICGPTVDPPDDAACFPAPSPTPTPCGSLTAPACGSGYCAGSFDACVSMSGACVCECGFCEASDLTLHVVGATFCDGGDVKKCVMSGTACNIGLIEDCMGGQTCSILTYMCENDVAFLPSPSSSPEEIAIAFAPTPEVTSTPDPAALAATALAAGEVPTPYAYSYARDSEQVADADKKCGECTPPNCNGKCDDPEKTCISKFNKKKNKQVCKCKKQNSTDDNADEEDSEE